MLVLVFINVLIVVTLVAASRKDFEHALPWFAFFLVALPGTEAKFVLPGLFDINTVRVALITLLLLYFFRSKKRSKLRIPLLGLMAANIAWATVSTVFSIALVTSAKQVITQIVEYFLIYYIFLRAITQVQTMYRIAFAIIAAMAVCSVFGMFEVYGRWSIVSLLPSDRWLTYGFGSPLYLEEGRGLRIRSTFPHPILFGSGLAMTIPLALYLVSMWKNKAQRIVLHLAIPLMFWAVYRTSSRGPWIATGLSLVIFILLVRSKARRYVSVLILLAALALVARPGVWNTISHLYEATGDSDSAIGSSYDYRYIVGDAVVGAVGRDPLRSVVGFGMGTFRQLGLEIDFLGQVQRWYTCDNNWALFLYETGYVGLLIIALLLLRALFLTFKGYLELPSPSRYFNASLAIGLAAYYLTLGGVAGYIWGQQAYVAWMFIALGIAHRQLAKATVKNEKEVRYEFPKPELAAVSASDQASQPSWPPRARHL